MWSYVGAYKSGRLDLAGFIHEAKRVGAEGVELLDFFYKDPDSERQQVINALKESGLPCCVFSVSQNFAKPTAEERNAQLDKIKFGVDEATRLGAQVVRVFAGDASEGIAFDQARDWILEGLSAASNYAHERGIKLALENHGKLAGRSDQVRGLIDEVRHRSGNGALGANPDTGNFLLVGQSSDEAIREVAPLAYMVHFKDFARADANHQGHCYHAIDGTPYRGTAIGEGDVKLVDSIQALRDAGFEGWMNVEYEADEDPFEGVARSMKNARKLIDG